VRHLTLLEWLAVSQLRDLAAAYECCRRDRASHDGSESAQHAGAPAGSVQFSEGTTPLGVAALVGGIATLTTSGAGTRQISATFSGDANWIPRPRRQP
jgi:hypothetical protein